MTAELVLGIVVAVFGSTGFWTFLSNRLDKKKVKIEELKSETEKQQKELNNMHETTNVLLKDRFIQMCRYLINQGYITQSQEEQLEMLHVKYEIEGLNGWGRKLYDKCCQLPVKMGE